MNKGWKQFITVQIPLTFSSEQRAIAEYNNRIARNNNALLKDMEDSALAQAEQAIDLSSKTQELVALQKQAHDKIMQDSEEARTSFRGTIASAKQGADIIHAVANKHRADSQEADRTISAYIKKQTQESLELLETERDAIRIKSAEHDRLLLEARNATEIHASRADNLKSRIYSLRDTLKAALAKQAALQNKIDMLTTSVFN